MGSGSRKLLAALVALAIAGATVMTRSRREHEAGAAVVPEPEPEPEAPASPEAPAHAAIVAADGTIVAGGERASVFQHEAGSGKYVLRFSESVAGRPIAASVGGVEPVGAFAEVPEGFVSVAHGSLDPRDVLVVTRDLRGRRRDRPFHLAVVEMA